MYKQNRSSNVEQIQIFDEVFQLLCLIPGHSIVFARMNPLPDLLLMIARYKPDMTSFLSGVLLH